MPLRPAYLAENPSRKGDIAFLSGEAAVLFACYVASAFLEQWFLPGPANATGFLLHEYGFPRIAFVVASIVFGLTVTNQPEMSQRNATMRLIQQLCLAVGIAFLAQALIGFILPGWLLPRYTMLLGSGLVLLVVPAWRKLYSSLALKA